MSPTCPEYPFRMSPSLRQLLPRHSAALTSNIDQPLPPALRLQLPLGLVGQPPQGIGIDPRPGRAVVQIHPRQAERLAQGQAIQPAVVYGGQEHVVIDSQKVAKYRAVRVEHPWLRGQQVGQRVEAQAGRTGQQTFQGVGRGLMPAQVAGCPQGFNDRLCARVRLGAALGQRCFGLLRCALWCGSQGNAWKGVSGAGRGARRVPACPGP